MFKFYLDNQLTDQPEGLPVTTIKRDNQLKGILITQEVELVWNNNNDLTPGEISGYQYIKSIFDESICNEIAVDIYDQISPSETYLTYTGIIKIPQIEISEQPVNIKAKVQDNSFYSYLYNNRELKVDLRATQTKNKINLTPINYYQVDLFSSISGVYGSTIGIYYKGYRVYDVFSFIVSALTDNKVSFSSTYLSTLTYDLMLFKGESLINSYTVYPTLPDPVFEISFQDLFNEIDKLKNLYYYIDTSNPDAPVLRIENSEQVYSGTVIYSFTGIKDLVTTIDSGKLYSDVEVGSTNTASGITANIYTFNEAISYYGWKRENFFPLGQCNVSARLNLVSEWVLSNNAIMDAAIGGSVSFIDNFFAIECDSVDTTLFTAKAHRYDYFGQATPPYFYNFGLNNYAKLQRHSDKFETIFGTFLGIGGNGFRALLGDDGTQNITYMTGNVNNPNFIPPGGRTDPARYVNETTEGGYDGNNNYSNVLFRYVVPVNGNYSFLHSLFFETEALVGGIDFFRAGPGITITDAALNVKLDVVNPADYYYDSFQIRDAIAVADLVAGDIVTGYYQIEYFPNGTGQTQNIARLFTVLWNSFLECNGTPEGGVSITAGNRTIKKLIHVFEYDIAESDWRTIQSNPTGMALFEKDGVTRHGWIEDVTHNNDTGRTKVKLISQDATT